MFKWIIGRLRCAVLDEHVRPWGYTRCRYCKRWVY